MPIRLIKGQQKIIFEGIAGSIWMFDPKEDITAYEVAYLLPYLYGATKDGFSVKPTFDIMPEIHRHFVKLDLQYNED